MSEPLNLARRPLRNERLPTLLLALACAILGALSVRHGVVASQLRHGGVRDVEGQVAALDAEIDRLRAEAADLQRTQPPRGRLEEWATIKDLVDRRAFSWTGLLADLETALPPSVRLVSIAPTSGQGPMMVALDAAGRSAEDAIGLMKALQASPAFEGAFLDGVAENPDGVQITCSVRYVGRGSAGPAATSPDRVPPAVAPASTGGGR